MLLPSDDKTMAVRLKLDEMPCMTQPYRGLLAALFLCLFPLMAMAEDPGAAIGHWRFEVDVVANEMTKVHWTGDSGMR